MKVSVKHSSQPLLSRPFRENKPSLQKTLIRQSIRNFFFYSIISKLPYIYTQNVKFSYLGSHDTSLKRLIHFIVLLNSHSNSNSANLRLCMIIFVMPHCPDEKGTKSVRLNKGLIAELVPETKERTSVHKAASSVDVSV